MRLRRHSVLGLGKTAPASSSRMVGDPEVSVPLGKCAGTKVKDGSLLYNEYIVYDVAQVQMRYLVQLDFAFKQ